MRLMGKIMRVVNTTVVITLFLSTLNVNAANTPVSFSEPPEFMISSENDMIRPEFEEPVSLSLIDNSALNEILP
jgi:hypothetical protein